MLKKNNQSKDRHTKEPKAEYQQKNRDMQLLFYATRAVQLSIMKKIASETFSDPYDNTLSSQHQVLLARI